VNKGLLVIIMVFSAGLIVGAFVGESSMPDLGKSLLLFCCGASFGLALKLLRREL
jgi:hypothetical protein